MYGQTGGGTMMWTIIVIVVLAIFIIPLIIKFAKGGAGVSGQNKIMQKYYNDYNVLSQTLQCAPPIKQEYQGYLGFPKLLVQKNDITISVEPATDYKMDHEMSLINRDPYSDMNNQQRMQGAAVGQTAMAFLGAVGGSSYNSRHRHKIDAEQCTVVKLTMPAKLQGTRILIVNESWIGKAFSLNEIKISHPGFDSAFNVRGLNAAQIASFLNPELCDKLLNFKRTYGKIQINENYLLWVKHGWGTNNVANAVNSLIDIGNTINKS